MNSGAGGAEDIALNQRGNDVDFCAYDFSSRERREQRRLGVQGHRVVTYTGTSVFISTAIQMSSAHAATDADQ